MADRRPHWLKVKLTGSDDFYKVKRLIRDQGLHTVCQSARCPNQGECWGNRTATFLILGDVCTRNCGFCAIDHDRPLPPDADEPRRVAAAVVHLGLSFAVVTSVTRDDLEDGGAGHFAVTIREIRSAAPDCQVEVLIPDFSGSSEALQTVLDASPQVLNHNIETVPALYPIVRPQAKYERSLELLRRASQQGACTKSGLMLGMGESPAQVQSSLQDLRQTGCQILTIGQYLPPSRHHLPVDRFVEPDEFDRLKEYGLSIGFSHVESGPLVRSSYHAQEQSVARPAATH